MCNQTKHVSKHHFTRQAAGVLQPEEFCALFPFNFGNFLKYVLRAPYRGIEASTSSEHLAALNDYARALQSIKLARADLSRVPSFLEQLRYYSPLASCFENQWVHKALPPRARNLRDFETAFERTAAGLQSLVDEGVENLVTNPCEDDDECIKVREQG